MSFLKHLFELFLHLDVHLASIIAQYGLFTYAIVFTVILCETGLVIAPLLPGDSLLFALGAFAARGSFSLPVLLILLSIAAIMGDSLNYAVGHYLGPRVFKEKRRFLNRDHLLSAEKFYERYGNKTIVIARFIPIIRTFAPLVAGIGSMHYGRFFMYNVIGGIAWVCAFTLGGYFFGNIPVIQRNFGLVIIAIVVLSLVPPLVDFIRHRRGSASASRASEVKP